LSPLSKKETVEKIKETIKIKLPAVFIEYKNNNIAKSGGQFRLEIGG
jgi:uncharacterized protein (DUF302 family)